MNKETIRKAAYWMFDLINAITPKTKKVFVYGGDFLADNSEAVLRYLANNYNLKIECIADKRINEPGLYRNVKFKKNTLFGALVSCITSKVVLDSSLHTVKMRPCRGQLFIQMWHGSPLKHLPVDPNIKNGKYYSLIFFAAEIFKAEMRDSLSADDSQMFLAGGPRNDYLLKKAQLPDGFMHEGKSVIWLPTFRRGIGRTESTKDIPIITANNAQDVENFLTANNIKLYIKAHPLQAEGLNNVIPKEKFSALRLISDDDLCNAGITLYELLGNMDALITDYSSVFFDYLLTDRQIGFAVDDIDEYKENRGFALQPPEEYMPGQRMQTIEDLFEFLGNVVSRSDSYAQERKKVSRAANHFADSNNCRRCAELVIDGLSR